MRGLPAGHQLDLEGRPVFLRTCGEGAPILLLHGLGATGALNWITCFEPLGRHGLVLAPDHRGHGRGARVGNRFRLADCADDAAAILRHLDAGPAVVVGYSMGGPIAQLLAHRHPELVAGLVLTATARDFRGGPADRFRFAAMGVVAAASRIGPAALLPQLIPVLPGRLHPVGWALAEVRRHEPAAIVAAAAALGRFTSRDWVGEIDVPTTVLVHERDRLVPPRRQVKLGASIAGARVERLDVDHLAVGRSPQYVRALVSACNDVRHRPVATGTPRVA